MHYTPVPMFTANKKLGFDIQDYPNSYRQYANEITLPLHTQLSDDDIEYISAIFSTIINEVVDNKEF